MSVRTREWVLPSTLAFANTRPQVSIPFEHPYPIKRCSASTTKMHAKKAKEKARKNTSTLRVWGVDRDEVVGLTSGPFGGDPHVPPVLRCGG